MEGLALIVNPTAGGGRVRRVLAEARTELSELGLTPDVVEARSLDHARDEAAAAAEAGRRVVAVGGDGLVGAIAGRLAGGEGELGIVPSGRGNDFARVLGIPFEARPAARLAVQGTPRAVDVADVDGRPYVGIASLGIDSDANRIANDARFIRGNLVYLYAGLRALAGWRHATFTVTVDGERHVERGIMVGVANSRAYGGGMLLVPHAELDDGQLDVLMWRAQSKLRCLRDLARTFKGTHLPSRYAVTLRGSVVEVSSDRPFDVYADGDPIGRTPCTMRVAHEALRVVVPPVPGEPLPAPGD